MAATLETEKSTKVSFSGLEELQKELKRQSKNQERLEELEKTINTALKETDKHGIIEFTENEWKKLIGTEGIAPIEEVRPILERRLEERKEITQEAKDAKKGIVATMKGKTEEGKNKAGRLVEKGKDLVENKAKGLKDAIMGKMSPWEVTKFGFNSLIFGLSVWFYGSLAKMGFKWAKDKLANKKKEEAEKLIAIAKEKGLPIPPELSKVLESSNEAFEKEKNEKGDEKKEKEGEKSAIEKFAPIGILSGLSVGMFAFAKKSLPESMTKNLSPEDGKGILKMATKSGRGLKLFGIAGVTLLGAGLLYNYLETDAGKKEMVAFPSDTEEKKKWWTNILEKAGVGIHEGANELWSLANGEKLDEYLTKRENERQQEGYCNLEDHPIIIHASKKLRAFGDMLTAFAVENKPGLIAALIAAGIVARGTIIDFGMRGADLALEVLKKCASHPLLLSLGILAAGAGYAVQENTKEAIKHIQVRENMTNDELGEMMIDIFTLKELREYVSGKFADSVDEKYIAMAGTELSKIGDSLSEWKSNFEKNIDSSMKKTLETLHITHKEKINQTNYLGLEAFLLRIRNSAEEKKDVMRAEYQKLLGVDGKGGTLTECLKKLKDNKSLTEGDMRALMEATNGTDILIFPAGKIREGATIQWSAKDEKGQMSLPRNLCINPTLETDNQYEEARNFVVNPFESGAFSNGMTFVDKISEGGGDTLGELAGAVKDGKGEILQWGTKTLFYDYAFKKYIELPFDLFATMLPKSWGGLSVQEFLVEDGQSFMPMAIIGLGTSTISAIRNRTKGFGVLNILAHTLAAPIVGGAKTLSMSAAIYSRALSGDLKGIIRDPAIVIKEGFIGSMQRAFGGLIELDPTKTFSIDGTNIKEKGELREIREKATKYKLMSDRGVISGRPDMQELREDIQKIVKRLDPETRKEIFGANKDVYINNIDHRDMVTIHQDIEIGIKKLDQKLRNQLAGHADILTQGNVPKTAQELKDMREKCEKKIGELETEKQKTISQNSMTPEKIKEYNKRTQQLQKAIGAINEHVRIRENGIHGEHSPETGREKWGRRGKGIIGLALLAGAMIGIQKLRSDEPGMSVPELDAIDEDRDFYGFRRDEDIPETEKTEKKNNDQPVEEKKTADIKNAPEYIRPFLTRMSEIQGMYGTEFDFICDPKALKESSSDTIESKVNGIINIHKEMLSQTKMLIKENQENIKRYYKESKEKNTLFVRKNDLNAFMGIVEKDNGEIEFEFMDEDDVSDTLWEMVDFERDNAEELIAGTYNNWDKAGYMAKRALPLSSEYYDGRDMIRNFSRGKIGDGFKSMGWLVGGAVCDIGMFFTFGGTGAVKAGAVGARTGIEWLKMSRILGVIKGFRIPLKIGEGAGILTKSLAFSMTHSGKLMLGGMGADMAHEMITFPRSESIKIDNL